MKDLIEAYLSVYEESDVAERTKKAVEHQRKGTHGDDHEMEKESKESTKAVKKATKYKGPKVTPSLPESYDVVLEYLMNEGYADTEENAITIMANMSEEWIDEILDEAADNVIMTVKSPSGQERSKIRKGASRPSDSHRHENPEQIANRRFSQQLADRKKEHEERMRAGRLTVATKKGIEAATNISNDGVGGNRFVQGSSARARERDDIPTDYRARRRRASGR